ncbi:hypothetical protein D3C77_440300 [compost metagenome]
MNHRCSIDVLAIRCRTVKETADYRVIESYSEDLSMTINGGSFGVDPEKID